jgi:hypothetical protein
MPPYDLEKLSPFCFTSNFSQTSRISAQQVNVVELSSLQHLSARKDSSVQKRKPGYLEAPAIGLGCMSTSFGYGPAGDRQEMISLIRSAVEQGVTFIDTGEVHGPFTNEDLVGEALAPFRRQVVIATKFGFDCDGGNQGGLNSQPANINQVVNASLMRLRFETIDLLWLKSYPIELPWHRRHFTSHGIAQPESAARQGVGSVCNARISG